ncbi:hypothetical protein KR100_10320 [Synechococcus sp. KORDI-100]|nr:hypothetical protein KR100_10320 [Synechococcus sp. KORDI-100]
MLDPYDLVLLVDGDLQTLTIQAHGHQEAWELARRRFDDKVRAVVYRGDDPPELQDHR